jgi:hypothetical protein
MSEKLSQLSRAEPSSALQQILDRDPPQGSVFFPFSGFVRVGLLLLRLSKKQPITETRRRAAEKTCLNHLLRAAILLIAAISVANDKLPHGPHSNPNSQLHPAFVTTLSNPAIATNRVRATACGSDAPDSKHSRPRLPILFSDMVSSANVLKQTASTVNDPHAPQR